MFRVGILGTENSHAAAFTQIFNEKKLYPDIKVVALGGHYPEESKKLADKYSIDFISEETGDMIGKIDALMVTARDGKYHYAFAKPYIEAGIPAFIDKPFTVNAHDGLEMLRLAKEKNVPLGGGSSVKHVKDVVFLAEEAEKRKGLIHGGIVTAPLSMNNEYSGFYFYSAHLVETSLRIFGYTPLAVTAHRCNNDVTAIIHYKDYDVVNLFTDGIYTYSGTIYAKDGAIFRSIDISDCYEHECNEFAEMLRNGKKQPSEPEKLLNPVYVLNAVFEAYNSDRRVILDFPEI